MYPLAFPWLSFHQVCVSNPCTRKSRRLFGLETSQLSDRLLSYLLCDAFHYVSKNTSDEVAKHDALLSMLMTWG